jgi:hypothetical protein
VLQHTQKKGTLVVARQIVVALLFFSHSLFSAFPKYSFALFDVALSGYLKGETYTDSRQTVADQEDQISYFPKPQVDDPAGHDKNARGTTRMDAFESRVCVDFSGRNMDTAQIVGKVEVDFEIFTDQIYNMPHMRHAYGRLDWNNVSFLFGQTWHPLVFIEGKTINYNGSSPFDFYARNPQFACKYRSSNNFNIIMTLASQTSDYNTDGVVGFSTKYMRDAIIPNFNLRLEKIFGQHIVVVAADYKRIDPRLVSDNGDKVHERLSSGAAMAGVGLSWPSININAKVNWGQNPTDYSGIGGYAVVADSTDAVSGERTYTNISNVGLWIDCEIVKNKKLIPGLFIGYVQNLGSHKKIAFDVVDNNGIIVERNVFGFANTVRNVFRISSRISSLVNSITLSGEVEYTVARYGTLTDHARVVNTRSAELIRCTFGAYYFF